MAGSSPVHPGAPVNGMWVPERGLGDTDGISMTIYLMEAEAARA